MAIKDLKVGAPTKLTKLDNEEHKTNPPSRFSETRLIAELEKRDIGRPATYASIVSLIQDRGYVARNGSQLYPTPLGFAIARLLAAKFPTFTAYEYTAEMEKELEEIIEGKKTRVKFLDSFWSGKKGFDTLVNDLLKSVDFNEIEQYTRVELHNGYSIRFTKFGTFLQDDNGKPDDKGYLPSARLADDVDVWAYKDKEVCEELMAKASTQVEAKELGILKDGEYEGWTVWAKTGQYGAFVQALHPKHVKAVEDGKKPTASIPKPINHPLPEDLAIETVEMKDISALFAEVKLPRWSPDKLWLTGIGKRGAYMGKKSTPRGRPVFRSLPEEHDPRTITFDHVKEIWAEADAVKRAAAEKKATAAAKKAAAPPKPKKTSVKVTPKKAASPKVKAK